MDLEQMIQRCPDITKLTQSLLNEVAIKKTGQQLNFNLTFIENGYDDLDVVELVMEIEKILDITIPDDVVDVIIKGKPPRFTEWIRNEKIRQLGL